MKKYFVFFYLFLIPFSLQANLLVTDKKEMLDQANFHRNEASNELYEAENMCVFIPNLGDRQHLKTLITSTIAAATIPDPRGKILTIGLPLIGSLVTEMFDNYCELRTHLANAAYHLEMANFYNLLSLHSENLVWPAKIDPGTRSYLCAIDRLTLCEMLTTCIEDYWTRLGISKALMYLRDDLFKQLDNNQGKLTDQVASRVWILYENVDEILAEANNESLLNEISGQLYNLWECLVAAEKNWGVK